MQRTWYHHDSLSPHDGYGGYPPPFHFVELRRTNPRGDRAPTCPPKPWRRRRPPLRLHPWVEPLGARRRQIETGGAQNEPCPLKNRYRFRFPFPQGFSASSKMHAFRWVTSRFRALFNSISRAIIPCFRRHFKDRALFQEARINRKRSEFKGNAKRFFKEMDGRTSYRTMTIFFTVGRPSLSIMRRI